MQQSETGCLIRLEGAVSLTSAEALKGLLMEAFASGKPLELNLEDAGDIDVAVLQLLWAAEREAQRSGVTMVSRVLPAINESAIAAGLERFPGTDERD